MDRNDGLPAAGLKLLEFEFLQRAERGSSVSAVQRAMLAVRHG
jgi:hypothetical protein